MDAEVHDCDKFKDLLESLIQKYSSSSGICVEALLPELYLHACQESSNYVPRIELGIDHATGVNSTQFDFNMITL